MAQLMQIQLQRFDAQPWGFRLQGGTDFAAPLVVQKINSGSLAEQAGLLPGDAVIKINDVDVYNLRHKDAQDLVVRSGNNFIVTVQRGGMTWRPSVTPTGQLPSPNPHSPYGQTVTKTSLAHKQQEVHHIGSGYNNSARPFNSVNGNDGQVKSIVNKQYNTPVGIYSDETIAETLSAQAEVLAGGVLGINFKKNEKQYSGDKSEVLKFLQEEETGEHEPEPRSPANFYWTHSHAIGGQRPSRPVTPASSKPHDERIGTPLQQNTLAPSASHRPSLPSHHPESRRGDAAEEKPPSTTTPTIDPRLIIAPVCPALQSPEYKAELEAAAIAAGVAPREQKPLTNLPQCAICGVGIVGVFVRIKDKNLHVECFKCATCGTSLKNQGYYNFNNKLYCDIHARLAASQNPPSGTEGYVPVPIKPNTKLSASTISAALNNIGYNGSPTNGTSTPLYSAPPSNIESTNISDLPLPPPPSPTQLQQFQIQDAFCNGNNLLTNTTLNNHSRTNSSLSTASSSSLSLSPYSSTNGINNNSSCSPINNNNAIIENSLNNHIGNPANNNNNNNNYNSTSTLSLDRFASSSSSSPGHSRQQSTSSSTGSGIITATDFQLPPPPPPPLPSSQQQQKHHQYNQIQQQLQQQQQQLNPNPNPMTINQSGKQNENDMNSNNRYASSGSNNPGSSIQTNGVGVNIGSGQGSAPSGGRADDSINSRTGQGQEGDQFQYVTCQGNVIRSVIPPGKGVSVNYKVNQGFARPYGAPAPAPAAAPKSPTSYPPPQVANQAGCNNNNNNNNWNQPRQIPVQHQQHQQQPASNMYATLPRSNAGPQETPASPTPAVPPTHARLSPSGLHHPDSIPTYQSHRKVLPEPAVLRENVPLAFVHSRSPTPNPEAVSSSTCCKGTCLNAQQQQKQQHQVHQQQQQQQSTIQQSSIKSSHTAASSSSTASRTMTRVSEQKQQQQYLTPTPTVPIIVEDRSGPVTMAFQSLDEHQPHDESYPPSRPYTPSLINKPAPIIPFYQTPEKLCFEECPATTGHVFDRRSVSPCPDRAKSPAPGPPPNPLSAIRAPRLRDSDLPTASPRTLQVGSITTGQSYLGAQQMQQQQQQQGQVLSHYQTASQSGSHSYVEKPEVVQQRQVGDLTIQKREKESRLAEEKKSQLESKTTSQVGNTQIERRRKVVEEYEHTQKAKTIEIRTGSSSSTTTSTTGGAITGADVRSSYGKTGFVANQARRLSGLEQEITNLTSQSQAISARAATLTETTFPQLSSPEPVSKFPIKTVLSPHYEPEPQKYVVSSSSSNKLVGPPPGFKQQQLSSSTQSSVSQKQQQQQTHSAQSSSSLAAVSSSCTLTNASATNQQQQSRPSAIPVPAYKPPPAPTHHAHHPQQPSAGGVGAAAGRCPVTGKVCSGAGSGAGSNVCRAPCSQSMQSQPSSNNNTYKPTASTGPAGFKPPQASQAPPQQMQSQQQPKQPLFKPNIPAVNVSNSPTSSFAPPPPTPSTQPAPGSGPSSNIGGKGKAFGATSAPKRGRGILNKAVESGVRVPLCSSCNMQIRGPFITALGRIWCPDHFMCVNANCRRPLQDVGFVEEKGDLYCEYCFEKYLAPTCSKCSGKIKGDCLNAIGRHFHPECFTCAHCGKLFGNTPFFLEEGMAYCEADWNELFTTKCFACGFPVEAGDRWVEALGNNYHSQCFNCTYCKKNLEGQSFYNKGGRPFCKNHAR
ncbi:PDZ and LIM domain protein Zasp isoform X7 [Episyrphus balteatus]|uniref:PDZ and LIM domain protein Zasp isoform X7 n=1 Tax=Episyrphus balteatus TaxID=286459 RepID=UPI002486B697|nr:PDZ and LIM domain protein Zasp isoform X7 [Episyrphus balteatus]